MYRFPHLGVQCVTKREVKDSLQQRRKMKIDPFLSKYCQGVYFRMVDIYANFESVLKETQSFCFTQ